MDQATFQNEWEKAAPGWAKWESKLAKWLAEATSTMLNMAEISSSTRVLDIASGSGSQTLQTARRIGKDGQIVATDISKVMLTHLRKKPTSKALKIFLQLRWQRKSLTWKRNRLMPPFAVLD